MDILAGASCVPVKAHQIFGGIGMAVSVVALGHAAYQLRRQVRHADGGVNWRVLIPPHTAERLCR